MPRPRYQRLNVAQCKLALAAGHSITAAGGEAYFDSSDVMRKPLNLPTTSIHRRAFDHLRNNKLIRLNEAKSKLPPPSQTYFMRSDNYYAVWEANTQTGLGGGQ